MEYQQSPTREYTSINRTRSNKGKMATTLLAPAPTSPKFSMERPLPLRSLSERRPSDKKRPGEPGSPKSRYSATTLKYSQMPLPTPPDSAGLEGFQLQFTLMPPTPGETADPLYVNMSSPKRKRRSIQVPYLLTVEDVADESGSESFSPSSTNYSAASEFGGPWSNRNTMMSDSSIPPLPDRASQIIKKRSPLSMETRAADLEDEAAGKKSSESVTLKPLVNTLVTSNLPSDYDALYSPITPVTPHLPFGPIPAAAAAPKLSLAERRARKAPAPLSNAIKPQNGSDEHLPTSPPPLTGRSIQQVQAVPQSARSIQHGGVPQSARSIQQGGVPQSARSIQQGCVPQSARSITQTVPQSARSLQAPPISAVNGSGQQTPQTATFVPQQKPVHTPITPMFPVLAAPQTSTPKSAAFFSPRSGAFPAYVPHSASIAAASPRQATFLPIHEDVDRDALRSPKGVNMLIEQAQVEQTGFLSQEMPAEMRERAELLWQVANAQADVDEIFTLGMYRQDSFTFTGAEHYTFGPDFTAPFYRISAHPSHEQDAIFSDLKIHRCSPSTAAEIPVIHLQLEAPTIEASGVLALIYPQVAGLMLEDGNQTNIKTNPRMDVAEEKECCRLVHEVGKGFALYHPFKGEDGGWLNVEVNGRVGFDVIGANGTISLQNPATEESLVSLDFSTCELFINAQACKAIPSLFIVDVAVAAVLTVATVEGRRLRVIQEDLDQIMAYEMDPTTPVLIEEPQNDAESDVESMHQAMHQAAMSQVILTDFSFAAAVGRMGAGMAITEGQKIAAAANREHSLKSSGMSKFGKAIAGAFRKIFRKMQRRPAFSPQFEPVTYIRPRTA